jgi:hypothetical protein
MFQTDRESDGENVYVELEGRCGVLGFAEIQRCLAF